MVEKALDRYSAGVGADGHHLGEPAVHTEDAPLQGYLCDCLAHLPPGVLLPDDPSLLPEL